MEELIARRDCHPRRDLDGWICDRWRNAAGEWFCGLCAKPLPPVALALNPLVGRSASIGKDKREIMVECARTPQTDDDDLADFLLAVDVSDPAESSEEFDIPLDASEERGHVGLGLVRPAGQTPFEVRLGLRHVRRSGASEPVVVGVYDYPVPVVRLDPPGSIALPKEQDAFTARILVTPADIMPTNAQLNIAGLSLSVAAASIAPQDHGLLLTFDPDTAVWSDLARLDGDADATLELSFPGQADTVSVRGLKVERMTPSRIALSVRGPTRGLTGRPARIAGRIRNAGGRAGTISRAGWTLRQGKRDVADGELVSLVGVTLGPREHIDDELRPVLKAGADPVPPGLYRLSFEIEFDDAGGETPNARVESQSIELEVKPDEPYKGLVCIDFGTTDTAAAILPDPDASYFEEWQTGSLPRPLELDRIAPPVEGGEARFFLPTRAAVGHDEEGEKVILYAHDALNGVDRLAHGRLLDRLKWRLGQNTQIDGFGDVSIKTLAGGYLDHVRRRIEEHPDVAGRIEKVVATRPARFGGGKELALIEAYKAAGMTVDETRYGSGAKPMVSESWPPVLFMVPMREEAVEPPSTRLLGSLFAHFSGEAVPEVISLKQLQAAPQYLCTFDIGGGSTDISLLELAHDRGRIRVRDLMTLTDDRFAGEWFRDLLVKEILAFAPGVPSSEADETGRVNLRAVRAAATRIQNRKGPFVNLYSTLLVFNTTLFGMDPETRSKAYAVLDEPPGAADVSESEVGEILRLLRVDMQEFLPRPPFEEQLRLSTASGAVVEVLFSDLTLVELMLRIVLRFAQTFAPRIANAVGKLAEKLPEGLGDGQVRVILTGRGSLFPPAQPLIEPFSTEQLLVAPEDHIQASGESAKAVTSWGAVALTAARAVTGELEFEGLIAPGAGPDGSVATYALYARRSIGDPPLSYTQLQSLNVDGELVWGAPLIALDPGFETARIVEVCEDLGPDTKPDRLARITGFDLEASRAKHPEAWLVFEAGKGVLEIWPGEQVDADPGSADVEEAQ